MNPLVSIVVPVYNVEKYLKKCIDSLIDQTYQNIEILLVDDGSTDNSGKICDDYAKRYSFVYSFHKANSGLGFTRNYGLERINGEYVTFVDSDDYLGKDAIKRLVAGLDGKSIDTVIGGYSKVKDNGDVLYTREYTESIFRNENVYKKLNGKLRVLFMKDISVEVCGGTHVHNTKEIEQFMITNFEVKGSGMCRIEAITSNELINNFLTTQINQFKTKIESFKEFVVANKVNDPKFEQLVKTISYDLTVKNYRLISEQFKQLEIIFTQIKKKLEKNGINVTIRREMGRDIDGACGQLRKKHIDKERGIN